MWHFRPEDADWVMVGPFFDSKVLSGDIPLYYANGNTYGVPWCAENVEKVRGPFILSWVLFSTKLCSKFCLVCLLAGLVLSYALVCPVI